jgi:hypothetical protein
MIDPFRVERSGMVMVNNPEGVSKPIFSLSLWERAGPTLFASVPRAERL